jgi:hypothetical protein
MVVLAVAAAPVFAYRDSQAGTPVGTLHGVADAHHHAPGTAATSGKTARVAAFRAHGRHIVTVPATASGSVLSITLLAVLVIGLIAASSVERRQASAKSARPARLPAFRHAPNHERKAA